MAKVSEGLGPRDTLFLQRVFSAGLDKYRQRLDAIGFRDVPRVLDAGCGFGQWTFALAQTCGQVTAIDFDPTRIRVARELGHGATNVRFETASIEKLPYPDASFEGVFCFSAIYYTDVRRSVKELARVLRPGGLIYLCSNGLGWYVYNVIRRPNPSSDFNPMLYGIGSICNSLAYYALGRSPRRGESVTTSRRFVAQQLAQNGIELIGTGGEGTLRIDDSAPSSFSFFRSSYLGMECVSEWLGRKRQQQKPAAPR